MSCNAESNGEVGNFILELKGEVLSAECSSDIHCHEQSELFATLFQAGLVLDVFLPPSASSIDHV